MNTSPVQWWRVAQREASGMHERSGSWKFPGISLSNTLCISARVPHRPEGRQDKPWAVSLSRSIVWRASSISPIRRNTDGITRGRTQIATLLLALQAVGGQSLCHPPHLDVPHSYRGWHATDAQQGLHQTVTSTSSDSEMPRAASALHLQMHELLASKAATCSKMARNFKIIKALQDRGDGEWRGMEFPFGKWVVVTVHLLNATELKT